MQGMSMGDQLSTQYGRLFGRKLAGIGDDLGPTTPSRLYDEEGRCITTDLWRSGRAGGRSIPLRSSLAFGAPIYKHRQPKVLDGIERLQSLPKLKLAYNENWAFYSAKKRRS
jgi:hypothetical protein